ncbi:MAG: hypothetical protein H0X37_03125 [Herpetosiphonaceae bacterium]|nr:hypothetical protein [Herpetosiphonaceae bacterium]
MILALFGGSKDQRRTPLAEGEQLIAAFGGIEMDLTEAPLQEQTYMSALAFCGGIKLLVPRGTDVVFSGFSLMGGREYRHADDEQNQDHYATIHLNSVAVMGGIEVVEV